MTVGIYDIETKKAVLGKNDQPEAGIQYAKHWGDRKDMGISVTCMYIYGYGYRVFMDDNLHELEDFAKDTRNLLVGWNSQAFDDRMLAAHDIPIANALDLKRLIAEASGIHQLSLASMAAAQPAGHENPGKMPGAGLLAPTLWQRGELGQLIDYCLADVMRTKNLVDRILEGKLRIPPSFVTIPIDGSRLVQFM